jgi:hypothetical protein
MIEWYAVRNSKSFEEFLLRNKEVNRLSYETEMSGRFGRVWVEDIYGNMVLLITDIPDGLIREVRCYAQYDPSFILFLLVKREGSQIMPEESPFFFYRHSNNIKDKDYLKPTVEFMIQIKKNKSYKTWLRKS